MTDRRGATSCASSPTGKPEMPWTRADDNPLYHTAEYRRARAKCLADAKWKCQVRLPGCQGAASQADHTDGITNDPHHTRLQAACKSCHGKITAQQGGGYRNGKGRSNDPPPTPRTAW